MPKRDGPAPMKQPLQQLSRVPIDLPYIEKVKELLSAHGATFVETREVRNKEGSPYKEFTITFPEGTVRVYDMGLSRSVRFTIYFPDGYEQQAAELWPLVRRTHDQPTTVLYLPDEEGKKYVALS